MVHMINVSISTEARFNEILDKMIKFKQFKNINIVSG